VANETTNRPSLLNKNPLNLINASRGVPSISEFLGDSTKSTDNQTPFPVANSEQEVQRPKLGGLPKFEVDKEIETPPFICLQK